MTGWGGAAYRIAMAALALAAAGAAHAQNAPAPAPAAIARSGAPTREEIERPGPAPAPAPSRLTIEGGIERAPCALADPRFAEVRITLADALFDHLGAIPPVVLRPAFADLVGRTMPIAAVCDIRDHAATILRKLGYLAAVQVPPQRIEGGVVHFDVLMAKLVGVQVRGHAGRSEALIASYLRKLTAAPVFNAHAAERYLLLARDLPGYDVRLTLKPAGTGVPGEVIGEVSVIRRRGAVDFNLQDYGSHQVGRWGGLLRGELYDVLGHGDRLTLGAFSTADPQEQQVLQAGYDVRLGPEGFALGGRFAYAWTHPDLATLDVASRTLVASLEASYPFVRGQAANLRGALGFDAVDQDVRLEHVLVNRDHVRTAYARLTFDATDPASITGIGGYSAGEPRWRVGGAFELRQGLDVLHATGRCTPAGCATVTPSDPQARPRGTIVRASAQLDWRALPNIAFSLSPQAQYAHAPLLSYERFSGGNYTIGRGYDPGAVIGDSGGGLAAEVRYGSLAPRGPNALAFQPYAFVDAAWAWRNDSQQDAGNPYRLVSAGGGVRAGWGDHARIDIGLAVPLRKVRTFVGGAPVGRRGDTRLLVSLTSQLLPWR